MLSRVSRTNSFAARRCFSEYVQPPLFQGKGAKDGVIPSNEDQATGREREELEALKQGKEYFNRQPVRAKPGQGTFENPVIVPSQLHDRIVGMIPKGQDMPIWFKVTNVGIHYVPEVDMHFKLVDPYNPFTPSPEQLAAAQKEVEHDVEEAVVRSNEFSQKHGTTHRMDLRFD